MAWWSALAGGGKSFLSSFGAQHGTSAALNAFGSGQDFTSPWGKGPYWNQKTITDLQRGQFDTTLKAAKDWKIHPLFALGSSANFSPSVGTEPRGRGAAGGTGIEHREVPKVSALQAKVLEAQAANDNAQAMYWQSRAAQIGQSSGGAPDASPEAGAGVKVFPLKRHSTPVSKRPLVEQPRQSVPERIELVDDQGRVIMGLNPDAGLDEVGQAEYLRLKAVQAVSDALTERARLVKKKKRRERAARERHEKRTTGIRRAFKR